MSIRPSQTAAKLDSTTTRRQRGLLAQAILAAACLTLLAAGTVRGQDGAAQPVIVETTTATAPATTSAPAAGPTTRPASAPAAAPTTRPAAAPTTAPAPEGPVFLDGTTLPNGQLLLNFQNAPLRSVLEYLSKATGLIVVGEPVLEGRVTVISRLPITLPEAVLLLDTVLRQKGYAAVYTGRNLKVVTLGQAVKENIPVQFGNDPNKIPESDRMVTQVIPVRFVDATKLKTDLTALVPAAATMAANQASNSLIYTDTQANIRRILKVIQALDGQMGSEATVKVYKLEYADATSTARLITDLFKEETSSQQSGRSGFPFSLGSFGRGGDRGGDRGGTDASSGAASRQSKVTATADTRTNNLVVSASPETLTVIDSIVKELDSDRNADVAVFIYKLRNAQAVNVESVVNNIFGTSGTTSRGGSSSGTSSFGRNSSLGGTSPFGGSSSSRGSSSGSSFGRSSSSSSGLSSSSGSGFGSSSSSPFGSSSGSSSRFGSGGTSSSGRSSYGSTPSIGPLGAAAGDLAGQVYVVADVDTNSLLVRTASKNFERVKAILEELDRPTRQVLIKVLLAEVTHDDTTDLGVEFSALNIRIGSSKTSIGTDFGVGAAQGGLIAKVVDVDYTATLRALQTVGKLNVLSRPYILASDNQQASITVGNVVPFIRDSRITDLGQTINTIQYEDIGIILYVIPHINPEGLVIMDVAPEISTLTGTTVPISETVNAPVFAKRSAQTRIAIRNGQTIVIGGLMEDRITDTIEKVPGLGDIPGIGALFRRTIKTKSKTELLIFLTPHVAALPEQLQQMSKEEKAGSKEFNKDENKEALDEQLKGMKLGATTMPADPTTMPTIILSDPKKNPVRGPMQAPGLAPTPAPGGAPAAGEAPAPAGGGDGQE